MRLAVISAHTCPLAAPGGKETGGMNVYVRETAKALSSRGLQIDIFTRSQIPDIPKEVQLAPGVRVIHVKAGPQRPYEKYRLLDHVDQFINEVSSYGCMDYELIHSHYWLSGLIAMELRRSWGIPVVHMFHTLGVLKNMVARNEGEREKGVRIEIERALCSEVDLIVASNPLEKAQLVWHYEADPQKIRIVPCGVDVSVFFPLDRMKARRAIGLNGRKALLFVGRLEPIKGLDTLLRAVSLLKKGINGKGKKESYPPMLMIIGGEKEAGRQQNVQRWIRQQAKSLGIEDDVILMGPRAQGELARFYAASEVCVLPSRYESFGMVALEAMACGTPVVASRVGGLNYTVKDGSTGLLVNEGDPNSLASSIAVLLEEEGLRERMGREAVNWAQRFSWERVVEEILTIYEAQFSCGCNGRLPLSC